LNEKKAVKVAAVDVVTDPSVAGTLRGTRVLGRNIALRMRELGLIDQTVARFASSALDISRKENSDASLSVGPRRDVHTPLDDDDDGRDASTSFGDENAFSSSSVDSPASTTTTTAKSDPCGARIIPFPSDSLMMVSSLDSTCSGGVGDETFELLRAEDAFAEARVLDVSTTTDVASSVVVSADCEGTATSDVAKN
jgi:hypothetical protein